MKPQCAAITGGSAVRENLTEKSDVESEDSDRCSEGRAHKVLTSLYGFSDGSDSGRIERLK